MEHLGIGGLGFPGDARGYTYGLVLDFNQPDWALRGGWMLEPKIPNEKPLAANFVHYHGAAIELELRDQIGDQKGKLRLLGSQIAQRLGIMLHRSG